jgi:hypothetical protein
MVSSDDKELVVVSEVEENVDPRTSFSSWRW